MSIKNWFLRNFYEMLLQKKEKHVGEILLENYSRHLLKSIETFNWTFLKIAICDSRNFNFNATMYKIDYIRWSMDQLWKKIDLFN